VTAEIFDDIRKTVGVRVVNLVWRHLATIDGALPWAWNAVKPLYAQGMVDCAAIRFREKMSLPILASLAGDEPSTVDAVLASYDHSNTINLFALGALVAFLRGDTAHQGAPEAGPRLPAPDLTLPKLALQGDTPAEIWALVLRLNRLGDPRPVILASMYRHLAHAPDFLCKLETALAPVDADGTLGRSIALNKKQAYERAKVLARAHCGGTARICICDRGRPVGVRRCCDRQDGDHLPGDPRRQGKCFRAQWCGAFALIG
jgi:hypothetical protein